MSTPTSRCVARALRPGGTDVIEAGVEDLAPLQEHVAGRFPLDHVVDAYRALESGARGKVLVIPAATG